MMVVVALNIAILITAIIRMMMMALKGAVRDCLQSPHCAANCLQHARSSDQAVITCKSRATHRAPITCSVSCAAWDKGTAQLLTFTEFNNSNNSNNNGDDDDADGAAVTTMTVTIVIAKAREGITIKAAINIISIIVINIFAIMMKRRLVQNLSHKIMSYLHVKRMITISTTIMEMRKRRRKRIIVMMRKKTRFTLKKKKTPLLPSRTKETLSLQF